MYLTICIVFDSRLCLFSNKVRHANKQEIELLHADTYILLSLSVMNCPSKRKVITYLERRDLPAGTFKKNWSVNICVLYLDLIMQLVCTSVQCNCYVQLYCSADDNFVHCSCFVHLNSVQCKDRRTERHLPPLTLTLDYLFKLMFISKDRDLMQINNLQIVFFFVVFVFNKKCGICTYRK